MILNANFKDYYEEEGCCLTCPDAYPGCLCVECKCRQCAHYDASLQSCSIAVAAKDKWEKVSIEIDEVDIETEKAWHVKVDTVSAWVPKSMAKIETEVRDECHYPHEGTLSHWQRKRREVQAILLPKWLAVEKKMWEIDEFDYWEGGDGINDK